MLLTLFATSLKQAIFRTSPRNRKLRTNIRFDVTQIRFVSFSLVGNVRFFEFFCNFSQMFTPRSTNQSAKLPADSQQAVFADTKETPKVNISATCNDKWTILCDYWSSKKECYTPQLLLSNSLFTNAAIESASLWS